MRRFYKDFWFDENGAVRDWGAMNEANVRALFEPSKKKGYDSIKEF
jgi:hypothetical protein